MADEIPSIQILDKKDYFQQALVPLPSALPYPPLPPSSLRLRTRVLGLTVNNFTYATLGTLLHWWDVHPLPASTPAPYNDASKYGRVSAWGYAEVLDSTLPSVPKGSYVWGYVPLGTLPQDLEARPHPELPDQVFVTSPHRARVMPIYNRYFVYPAAGGGDIAAAIAAKTPEVARDAVLRVMHATAFLLSRFVFNPSPSSAVAPGPGPDDAWGAKDADLSDATVVVFAPGSKVATLFAALLARRAPGKGARPRRIVGASSASSRAFVEGTGVYDGVVLATAPDPVVAAMSGVDVGKRVVVFDFGGRAGVGARWAEALSARYPEGFLYVGVGAGVVEPADAPARLAAMARTPPFATARVNADDMRRRAMASVGEAAYWAEEGVSWEEFRRDGVKGLEIAWGEGMGDVVKGWDRLARGEVLPSEGLVYRL
ncbi:hypothetical protein GGS24DRAFT_100681 [Hypoxylon argillaceum]|nr:hypothetical protein GGS24DRAFT_100681 [Hypoxylon argillaceum]